MNNNTRTKLFTRGAEIFRLENILVVLGDTATTFRERAYACMYMNTSESRSCSSLRHLPFKHRCTYAVAVLYGNHALESGRGDDEGTGNTQHTHKTTNGVVRASTKIPPLLLRQNATTALPVARKYTYTYKPYEYHIIIHCRIREHFFIINYSRKQLHALRIHDEKENDRPQH